MTMAEQVKEVETARDTNIRVASRVMGWTQWEDLTEDCPCEPSVTYFADWDESHGLAVYLPDGDGDVAFYFNPAEDIRDAWRVVEVVAAKTKWYALCYRPTGAACNFIGDTRSEVLAAFDECDGSRERAQALAICRAALQVTEQYS